MLHRKVAEIFRFNSSPKGIGVGIANPNARGQTIISPRRYRLFRSPATTCFGYSRLIILSVYDARRPQNFVTLISRLPCAISVLIGSRSFAHSVP
jgi:hypothetical protein